MIELMILGFLAEGPRHGYELRKQMAQLQGYARRISDGTIYPAIKRLMAAGAVAEQTAPGTGSALRKVLQLTPAGRERLLGLLRDADGQDISDGGRFIVVLSFLSLLPDPTQREAVLSRRLAFLEKPASFFYEGQRPLRAEEVTDPYRRGVLLTARATGTAERAWLREQLGLTPEVKA